ncbi:MICOS complex subunit MIC27 [Collichthys lucidus]|uniref:MICOS complex subunit n=1 Tax=Collichthys lucidus TaxID=240159 RepID=A0A4U5UDC9_COLLU|nr:MICOS complex subunit MIC27 [Collichthys lucidus]
MAAKVVIVAVPTVLGIASIRVCTEREAPTDGLVKREKLNVYTPLPGPAQPQFVPEEPGVIQSGLTTARETIQPLFQAVKDPPPEFLPRFGTITMAGLLGMFLARKGSRFKRVAVPLGLMSAGASVCYPAQAVAVLKVTGKKVYAAGNWSKAAVSSLFTPKPQELVPKETAAPQFNSHEAIQWCIQCQQRQRPLRKYLLKVRSPQTKNKQQRMNPLTSAQPSPRRA